MSESTFMAAFAGDPPCRHLAYADVLDQRQAMIAAERAAVLEIRAMRTPEDSRYCNADTMFISIGKAGVLYVPEAVRVMLGVPRYVNIALLDRDTLRIERAAIATDTTRQLAGRGAIHPDPHMRQQLVRWKTGRHTITDYGETWVQVERQEEDDE